MAEDEEETLLKYKFHRLGKTMKFPPRTWFSDKDSVFITDSEGVTWRGKKGLLNSNPEILGLDGYMYNHSAQH